MTRSQATPTSSQSITMERMISELTDTISDLQAKVELLEQIETNLVELHNVALVEVDRLKAELAGVQDKYWKKTAQLEGEVVALKSELEEVERKQGFCFACGEGLGS